MSDIEKIKQDMRDMINVQCSNGNWNYDEYMHGMANGMLLMMSVVDGQEPVFLETPEVFLCNLPKSKEDPVTYSEDAQ